MIRLAIMEPDANEIIDLLAGAGAVEQGCFLLLREGRGRRGRRLLATEVILPPLDAWERQASVQLRPSGRWVSAAVSRAVSVGAGLLFVHSHPDPEFPAGLSTLDREAVAALGEALDPILDGPFGAVVVHPRGWSGVLWTEKGLAPLERISSVGRTLRALHIPEEQELVNDLDLRQVDALGTAHQQLRGLHVGLVGVGGTGSPLAEQLVRMGVAAVTLIDPDVLDTPSNVRRVFGSRMADCAARPPRAKVDIVGDHLDGLGLGVVVHRLQSDVRNEVGLRALLDTDIVLCCSDTHGSRAAVNELPSTYLLPVIDVGARVGRRAGGELASLAAEIRVLTPLTPCLWCREAISADRIRAENMPSGQRERLVREGYVVGGGGEPVPSVVSLTVLGAGLAGCALLAMLSGEGQVVPSGYVIDGFMGDALVTRPAEPVDGCRCRQRLGMGDSMPLSMPVFRA